MARDALKTRILGKFRTVSYAANTLDWDRKKVYRVFEHQTLTEADLVDLVTWLDVKDADELVQLCFPAVYSMFPPKPVPDTISGPAAAEKIRDSYIKSLFGRLFHRD